MKVGSQGAFLGYKAIAVVSVGLVGAFLAVLLFLAAPSSAQQDQVSFGAGELSGGPNIDNPTSLQFGPDGRLYVSERFGLLHVLDVERNGPNDYQVTDSETINSVKNLPNHNDDGAYNQNVNSREVTGLVVGGTAQSPILYVSSSDPRVGGGGNSDDKNIDTNSGVISRLTPAANGWDHEMLVRGLPRSEENHAPNGLELDESTNTLYLAEGGHTNKGAPSNNFVYTPEYALSAAILDIDLGKINGMSEKDAANTDVPYLYDLPTIGDSPNQPFGGKDGQNMAKLVQDGPVGIYSPGYRNSYDVTQTEDGQIYTFDNGPNGGWGGQPVGDGTPDCTNEPNEGDSYSTADNLHLVTEGSYGGHANPTRGNPDGAGLYEQKADGQKTGSVADAVYDGYNKPVECDYQDPSEDGSLTTIGSSTNGLDEYSASNFDGAMQGDLLAAAFDGNVYRIQLNDAGDSVTSQSAQFSNGLSVPLDVTTQGDDQKFGGTVWVADFGGDDINVFEPSDSGGGGGTSCDTSDPSGDADGDGYTNQDEQSAGTDPCSEASTPNDYDNDNISNTNDPDDDNDGLDDTTDPFAVDPDNGLSTNLPVQYDFSRASQPDSLEGIGFTGLMTNGENYQDLYVPEDAIFGGANPAYTQEVIKNGDAFQGNNTQQHAFQFGVNTPDKPFVVHSDVTGYPENPKNFQSAGIQIGTGDQNNYLKLVVQANGGTGGLEMVKEVGAKATKVAQPDDPSVTGEGTVTDLYLTVDPSDNTVVGEYAVDGGDRVEVGQTTIPESWLNNQLGGENIGLATGVISTSFNASQFSATWNDFEVVTADTEGNQAPSAEAGPNKTVDENNEVQLDGTGSNDPEGEQLGYSWTQTGGPDEGSLSSQDSPAPTFNAPEVDSDTTFTFELTVTDSADQSDTDTVDVLVKNTDTGSGGGSGETVFAINAGGPGYTAQDGTVYQADSGEFYSGSGGDFDTNNAIDGTENDPLYQTERYGGESGSPPLSYNLPVNNGTYEVTLKFAEIFQNSAGQRVFSANLEGNDVELTDYDIYAEVGKFAADDKTYTVDVNDSELNIDFSASEDNAKIGAIKVVEADVSGGGGNQTASTGFTVNGGNGNIDASTFSGGSFEITNTGGKQISSVTYDLSPVTLPDIVFDPEGTAGDSGAKGFTPDSGGDQTGLQDGSFSAPQNGQNGDDGFNELTATFNDFQSGETFAFSTDIDPTSIKNAQGTGEAGSVSGLELSGATVTVGYADGSTQTTDLFGDGSQGGSEANAQADDPAAPALGAQGVQLDESALDSQHSAATVSEANQTITVSGPAGATVELLRIEGQLVLANEAEGYKVEEYEANTAEQVEYKTVQLDGNGQATVPVTLTNTSTENAEGGFNYFIAATQDGSANTGATSNTVILEYNQNNQNQAPTAQNDSYEVNQDDTLQVNAQDGVLSNDSDPDGDNSNLTASVVQGEGVQNGTLNLNEDGSFSYDPDDNYSGEDSFTYEATDTDGGSDTATVTITVDQANPTPDNGCTITGTQGDDELRGTPGDDVICGLGGDDKLYGFRGDDILRGGEGNDRLVGGPGDDRLSGQDGDDTIFGTSGEDYVNGGSGNDIIRGNQGNDRLIGASGSDSVIGGEDDDTMFGGPGRDRLFGQGGEDRMFGISGPDYVNGGPDNDIIRGNQGNDRLVGADGNDGVVGGENNDTMFGGPGRDRMTGQGGADRMFGISGPDYANGGSGNDLIRGNQGNDRLVGASGNDTVIGNENNDTMFGGQGNDRLFGQEGRDTHVLRDGVRGNDSANGGSGRDKGVRDPGDRFVNIP